jgi:hypothetical protein
MKQVNPHSLFQNNIALREAFINRFIDYIPENLDYAIRNDYNTKVKELCAYIDLVDFHYRHYVAGTSKTLHRVLYEVRQLTMCNLYRVSLLLEIINSIEKDILLNELYEVMPRYLYAKKNALTLKR